MRLKPNESRIWVAGSRGMVGAAITRHLETKGLRTLSDPSREELDLRRQSNVEKWMRLNRPDVIFLAAGRVGGIVHNADHPADYIADNLQIETNIITTAAAMRVTKLVFLGSSCIYPRLCTQPMREEYLMSGALEETNRAYAMAKLAGVELVRAFRAQHGCDFISVLPCNLFGPGDTYHAHHSHVIPALMLKIRTALEREQGHITVWGTGEPMREFLHADDLADAVVHLAQNYNEASPINVGTGKEISIRDLTRLLCEITGFSGAVVYDTSQPDGTPRKVLDVTRLSETSWRPRISLKTGLAQVWKSYLSTPHQTHLPQVRRKQTA
jgi:GDP-L-fucose synthase